VTPPEDVVVFGHAVVAVLGSILTDELVGAYFVGSIALGGYVRGQSDIDIVAICGHQVDEETKTALAERLLETTVNCPARGLEFTLYAPRSRHPPRKTQTSRSTSTVALG
jgi:tRNA nucleotidyltransferase (CCA-adding enzyme)